MNKPLQDEELVNLAKQAGGTHHLYHELCVNTVELNMKSLSAFAALLSQRTEQAKECRWQPEDDDNMPGTYSGSCGAMWTFTDGGVVENDLQYCPQCGGKVIAAPADTSNEI